MTFEQFQATGRDVSDVREAVADDGLPACPGRIYADYLYIVRAGAGWWTIIGNREHKSTDLAAVERPLYDFAVAEGIA